LKVREEECGKGKPTGDDGFEDDFLSHGAVMFHRDKCRALGGHPGEPMTAVVGGFDLQSVHHFLIQI
jgi:hypothetical protein